MRFLLPVSGKAKLVPCLVWLMVFLRMGIASAEESDALPLPRWTPGDTRATPLEDALWPKGTIPAPPDSDAGKTPSSSGVISNFFKLFIPDKARNAGTSAKDGPKPSLRTEALTPLPMESFQACFDLPKDSFLLDPQHLITETQAEDIRHLLMTRAEDARIAVYFLVINRQQTLPANLDMTQLASGALGQRPSCLVVYPLGAPQRARMFSSREISELTPAGSLSSLIQECMRDAQLASEDLAQMERFVTQLSIRLFWLERSLPVAPPATEAEPSDGSTPPAPADALHEVAPTPKSTVTTLFEMTEWKPLLTTVAWPLATVIAVWYLLRLLFRLRRRRLARTIWLLPERTPVQRLGGPHCGGCGAMVKYG